MQTTPCIMQFTYMDILNCMLPRERASIERLYNDALLVAGQFRNQRRNSGFHEAVKAADERIRLAVVYMRIKPWQRITKRKQERIISIAKIPNIFYFLELEKISRCALHDGHSRHLAVK